MKKIIRLTESDIHYMVKDALQKMLFEKHVLKVPNDDKDIPMNDMGGLDMPPMGDDEQMQQQPPMDDGANFDMSGEDDNGGNSEIDDIMSKLSTEQQSSVIKYAKSMIDDSGDEPDDSTDGGMQDDSMMDGEMPQAPIQENNVVFDKRERNLKRKELGNVNTNSPFVSKR